MVEKAQPEWVVILKMKPKWKLLGLTLKQYIRDKIRPEVDADYERLRNSPGWRKKK